VEKGVEKDGRREEGEEEQKEGEEGKNEEERIMRKMHV
jgi:hypothetical protein